MKWYERAFENLALIEQHAGDHEDKESGDVAPSPEVFKFARNFLNLLACWEGLETPRFFLSPNGDIVIKLGNEKRDLHVRVMGENKLSFYFVEKNEKITGTVACAGFDFYTALVLASTFHEQKTTETAG